MDLDTRFQDIMTGIKLGHRGLTRFTTDELSQLEELLILALGSGDWNKLEKVLCLIEHSSALHSSFERPLLEILKSPVPDPLIVFTLNCARRHIILARGQRGHRMEYEFLESLKKHLHSTSPEVVEWTLRTIEECGNQGVYFLREFDKIKPAPWKWFNAHQRAVRELITMLERRWSRFEKS